MISGDINYFIVKQLKNKNAGRCYAVAWVPSGTDKVWLADLDVSDFGSWTVFIKILKQKWIII